MLHPMNRSSTLRSMASFALCGLTALVAIGFPLSYDADHQSDLAHIEHDHGGHGTVLLEQDEQILTKSINFSAVALPKTLPWIEATATVENPPQARRSPHTGSDPPKESRPRAPPILIS